MVALLPTGGRIHAAGHVRAIPDAKPWDPGNRKACSVDDRLSVFLSSTFRDQFDGETLYVPLRARIIENKRSLPVFLWAYEHFWPKNSESAPPDADTIVDRCFAGIKKADLFVFLLTGSHGSGTHYFEDPTWATYLELELFAAALLKKPIVVLHLRGHEPSEALRDTLALLGTAFSSAEYVLDDEDGLYRHFLSVCELLARGELRAGTGLMLRLPEWLSLRRTAPTVMQDIDEPRLVFLGGRLSSTKETANPDLAARLLAEVATGTRSKDGSRALLPHGSALFRLWAAMRELMDTKASTASDPATAVLWDRALGLWAGNASWFGLHGHVWMGPLAAINSQTKLREGFASTPEFTAAADVREPVGARASAIYSIAQRMDSKSRKLFHYKEVVRLATTAIDRDKGAQQGALSIRGHALMRMAQLGHVWHIWGAARDFRKSLDLRVHSGAKPAGDHRQQRMKRPNRTDAPVRGCSPVQHSREFPAIGGRFRRVVSPVLSSEDWLADRNRFECSIWESHPNVVLATIAN